MATRKAASNKKVDVKATKAIVLAEKLGTLLGRSVAKLAAAKRKAKSAAKKLALPKRASRGGEKPAAKKDPRGRSGGTVDAPGKRHRKPPPQELFDSRLGEPMGKQMGQKSFKKGMRSGRG
jgi:hypothetical protein